MVIQPLEIVRAVANRSKTMKIKHGADGFIMEIDVSYETGEEMKIR